MIVYFKLGRLSSLRAWSYHKYPSVYPHGPTGYKQTTKQQHDIVFEIY